jgi:hypothetical protein
MKISIEGNLDFMESLRVEDFIRIIKDKHPSADEAHFYRPADVGLEHIAAGEIWCDVIIEGSVEYNYVLLSGYSWNWFLFDGREYIQV